MRLAGLALAAILLAACARTPGAAPRSGIRGRVVAAPTCPVETAASPCPPEGVRTTVFIESADGGRARTVPTDADGRFRVGLPPGDYVLRAGGGQAERLIPRPAVVTVEPAEFARVRLILDTGLREPAG